MRFGLEEHIVDSLISVFEEHSKVDKAIVFGSRAKGNYRPDSDIDIAIKGQELTTDDIILMAVAFEAEGITYKIDLIDYNKIKEPDLKAHIDRVGIELYSRWKEIPLSKTTKFIVDNRGKTVPTAPQGIPLIATNCINNSSLYPVYENLRYISQDTYDTWFRSHPQPRDIILTLKGSQNGAVCLVPDPFNFAIAQDMVALRADEKIIDPLFLFAALRSEVVQHQIKTLDVSGVIPHLKKSDFDKLILPYPDKLTQKGIGEIYFNLSCKIDLLHRQNRTLEQLAETLFRQWFVEEVEESWKVEPLGEVFDIGIGRTPPRKEQHWFTLNPKDLKWVSIKDMGSNGLYIDTVSEYLTEEAVRQYSVPIIPENTVMLSFKMTIGRLAISSERMVSNEAIAHFKQKEGSFLFPEFLYLFLKTYSWVELGSTSSIVESINSQMIKEIEMIIPNKEKLLDFKELIRPIFDKIKSNQTQIRTLIQTRDTLLPKLMTGEIRILEASAVLN
jgi:type I restriction enzyme, S subunit